MHGPFGSLAPGLGPGLGFAAALLALVVVALLEPWAARLRAKEGRSRWASNGRDVVATLGLGAMWLALRGCGLPWAAALLYAGLAGIALELIRPVEGSARLRAARALGLAGAIAGTAAAFPEGALAFANRVGSALF